jgi:AraC-like DNA-binding protein
MIKNSYLEKITHTTNELPYSLHKTFYSSDDEYALYPHLHPDIEFLYLEDGELDFEIENTHYRLHSGEAFFIPPYLLHCARTVPTNSHGCFQAIVFSPNLLLASIGPFRFKKYASQLFQRGNDLTLQLSSKSVWQNEIIKLLCNIFQTQENQFDTDLLINGYLLVIWQYLYNHHILYSIESIEKNRNIYQLNETIEYINNNFQNNFSSKELSEIAHMSEGQLCRSFKCLTGLTPFTYIKHYRIRRSCEYLSTTAKKISEICSICGFNNISYFNREFAAFMHITPSQYRKQCRKKS